VSRPSCSGFSFADKAPFEDQSELQTWSLLQHRLNRLAQRTLLGAWKAGEYVAFAAKYKPVSRKVRPVN
jgi:hypothetical protein